jgi:hypothetical protein
MATSVLKDLRPEERAVLSLVLSQGRSYEEVARLSQADPGAIRARVHAAAEQLVPPEELAQPEAGPRGLIIDYLLGAQTHAERVRTCYLLAGSPVDREWAARLARSLAPLSKVPLPVIPGARLPRPSAPPGRQRRAPVKRSTFTTGGVVLLLAIVIAVVVVLASAGGSGRGRTAVGRTVHRLVLTAPAGRASAAGDVLVRGGAMLLLLQGRGLAPNHGNSYAVWLFNAPGDDRLLGLISPPVGRGGTFSSGTTLPDDAVRFHSVVITLERNSSPASPGTVVLRGPLSLS